MNNVVSLNAYAEASQPARVRTASPIEFKAYERPLWYEGKEGTRYGSTGHKALIRMEGDAPTVLNVVKDTYKVVQNAELFDAVESGLRSVLGHQANSATIKDSIAHNGKLCYRQYAFSDISIDSPERDRIVFRVIVVNGFGGSAIKLHAGAIDMFCTNGMILGDFTSEYAKHTSGVKIAKFTDVVAGAVDIFWKNKGTWKMLRDTMIKNDDTVVEWLNKEFGERLGLKLYHQYLIEKKVRGGNNMWALYSTLTHYSSHANGEFSLRNTKNDHAAATMLGREQTVRQVLQSGAWETLRRAA